MSEVSATGSTLVNQKKKRALTCYFPPHPGTHKEPHEKGEEQCYPKGDERYGPHGQDQAEHWETETKAGVSGDTFWKVNLKPTYFLSPNPKPVTWILYLIKLSIKKKYAILFGIESCVFKTHSTL